MYMDWMLPGCQDLSRPGRKLFILARCHGIRSESPCCACAHTDTRTLSGGGGLGGIK